MKNVKNKFNQCNILLLLVFLTLLTIVSCGTTADPSGSNGSGDGNEDFSLITPTSTEFNNGENISLLKESPQITWNTIDSAYSYAIVLTDGEKALWGKYNLTAPRVIKGDISSGNLMTTFSPLEPESGQKEYFFIVAALDQSRIELDVANSAKMDQFAQTIYNMYVHRNSKTFNDHATPRSTSVTVLALGLIKGYAKAGYAKVVEVATQTTYQRESRGAPPRPNWVDAFRTHGAEDFFKKGSYPLVWRKDPGNKSIYADRWEMHQIIFKDPTVMQYGHASGKWGKALDPEDIKETRIIYRGNNQNSYSNDAVEPFNLPADVLPSVDNGKGEYTKASTTETYLFDVNKGTQVGYLAILPTNNYNRNLVTAYKVRLIRDYFEDTPTGEVETVGKYNDSQIMMVEYRNDKAQQITETSAGTTPGGSGPSALVPDAITNLDQLRAKTKITAPKIFRDDWENRKITGTAPLEELMTKADFETLFPANIRTQFHDRNNEYYTWENFLEASRYFPTFLKEGDKETRYRELAAFLGNKSHETGDGWAALKADRWSYGLVWIVELSALGGSGLSQEPKDPEDLHRAYVSGYVDAGNANYPPVEGKSYHGRGPVQLSWNYNYGQMSETLFGDKNILLENPNLISRHGILGWASAIWFWMQPQDPKPSAHDVMVGNYDLSEPYTVPIDVPSRVTRTVVSKDTGRFADGTTVADYSKYRVPLGAEVGFGMTINIINGGLESGAGVDNRHARRIGFFARYLDYFGTTKNGRTDGKNEPISPQIAAPAGDPVPEVTIEAFANWENWIYLPADGSNYPTDVKFPTNINIIPNVVSTRQTSPW